MFDINSKIYMWLLQQFSAPRAVRFANLYAKISYLEQLKGSEYFQTNYYYRKNKLLQSLTLVNNMKL